MDTKSLLIGIISFIAGGLLVSTAAVTINKPEASMKGMITNLESKTGDDYDASFIRNMIAHHQAAIDMARLSATNAKHDEIKKLSGDIISAQDAEITQMKLWQKQWGYDTTPSMEMNNSH